MNGIENYKKIQGNAKKLEIHEYQSKIKSRASIDSILSTE